MSIPNSINLAHSVMKKTNVKKIDCVDIQIRNNMDPITMPSEVELYNIVYGYTQLPLGVVCGCGTTRGDMSTIGDRENPLGSPVMGCCSHTG